jgi:hypothetical protein
LTEISDVTDRRGERQVGQLGDSQSGNRIPNIPQPTQSDSIPNQTLFLPQTSLALSIDYSPDAHEFNRNMNTPTKYPLVFFWSSGVLARPSGLFSGRVLGRRSERVFSEWDISRLSIDAPSSFRSRIEVSTRSVRLYRMREKPR